MAVEKGAQFLLFQVSTKTSAQRSSEGTKLQVPAIEISPEDGQTMLEQGVATWVRQRDPDQVGEEFGKAIEQGGVLTLGQEPDIPWGHFGTWSNVRKLSLPT